MTKVVIYDEYTRNDALRLVKDAKEGTIVEVRKVSNNRTSQQNRLFHANLQLFHKETGNDMEKLKIIIKDTCPEPRMYKLFKVGNDTHKEHRSTADLDTKEFSDLMDFTYNVMESQNIMPIYPKHLGLLDDLVSDERQAHSVFN